jgi:DHA1 family tetracycline resistance protein-like MFS transporter
MASMMSLASIFGPLFFAWVYYGICDTWPGIIWLVGVGIYVLSIPLVLSIRGRPAASEPA